MHESSIEEELKLSEDLKKQINDAKKEEFILLYTRFHFHVDKESDWKKLKTHPEIVNKSSEIIEWEATKLYEELVRIKAIFGR